MAFVTIDPPAGLYRNGTIYQAKGRWYDANLIRFQQDERKPVGGWRLRSASAGAFTGLCRALLSWRDNSNTRWIAAATSKKLYVQDEAGVNHDITPLRKTTNPLANNPITTVSGSGTVTITDNAHGAIAGDFVTLSGATAFNGLTVGQLNQTFTILTVPNANTYTVATGGTASASSAGGGAAVVAKYQITAGRADASQNLGYGGGAYGASTYGTPRANTSAYIAATVWSLDTWGEHLVGCSDADGKLYEWSLSTSTPAAVISGAPTSCKGVVVTPERFMMALGAGGSGRNVAWCDQEVDTTWVASSTNQAGDFDLQTPGTLQCGRAMRGQTLLLTDVDAWVATYINPPLVYGFQRAGTGCGIVAKGAIASRDAEAVWMGNGGFWLFDGQSVRPLDCDVHDYVFADMNQNQISKVTSVHNTAFGEVWWFYPSGAATENDRYVVWAYRESERLGRNIWTFGQVSRTAGTGRGVFPLPLMVDATGLLYEHETGWSYDGAQPYLEAGPQEIANGDYLAEIMRIIPDEKTAGDVNATLYGRMWPNGDETTLGTYSLASPTDLLVQTRELRVRYTGLVLTDFRIGNFRLETQRGDPI